MDAMKTIYNKIAGVAMSVAVAACIASCSSEAPFSSEGEAVVRFNVDVNSRLTRAVPVNNQDLLDNCVVYVSNQQGLLHKWIGVDNIPDHVYMRYGSYTAEAWSGDSVSAAFESENKKFFKGIKEFTVNETTSSANVDIVCKLANVVASVDETTINNDLMKDVEVTFSHTRGSLVLNKDNWSDKAYFMMPNGDTEINYYITGKNQRGATFTKEGVIPDVQSAHEYRLQFKYDFSESTDGGAFIQIEIDETVDFDESDVTILGRPVFAWQEGDIEVGSQIVGVKDQFTTHSLRIAAFNGFESVTVMPEDDDMFRGYLPEVGGQLGFELTHVLQNNNSFIQRLEEYGIEISQVRVPDNESGVDMVKYTISFTDKWLNSLPVSEAPYELTVVATDLNGMSNQTVVSIANNEKAIVLDAPVNVDLELLAKDAMAIRSTSATLPLTYVEGADLTNAALQYREIGSTNWITKSIDFTRASVINVSIGNLKPGTQYEYRTVAGKIENGEYELKSNVNVFTTETKFIIPNASFEDWSSYSAKTLLGTKNVILPGSTGDKTTSFWGSGNEGSATANMTLTDKYSDVIHSGSYSARLESKSALGVIAAGNIFVGEYVKTDGTNGVLSVGREYDGSHPSALSVWVNYRPGNKVSVKSGNEGFVPEGFANGNDHGQIYIALTTAPVELRTNPNNRKLFNPDDPEVLAYGEVTWTGNFGQDGTLENVKIPFVYNDRAKTNKPTHIVIVASATKYGDYFSGSAGSVLCLDDFELVYE